MKNLLERYEKEELMEIISVYNEYQKECPIDEQLSIGSFVLSNSIAKQKYKDNQEAYEENKYPKIKTLEDRMDEAQRKEQLRKLISKPDQKSKFYIGDCVEDSLNNLYYYIIGIIKRNDKIFYRLKRGAMEVEIEEKYLIAINIISATPSKEGLIITKARRV